MMVSNGSPSSHPGQITELLDTVDFYASVAQLFVALAFDIDAVRELVGYAGHCVMGGLFANLRAVAEIT